MAKPKYGAAGGAWNVSRAIVPLAIDVRAIRLAEKDSRFPGVALTQAAFAKRYGLSLATVQDWEQGRRKPGPVARVLLQTIKREPAAVRAALRAKD